MNRTDTGGVRAPGRLGRFAKSNTKIMRLAVSGLAGFVLANSFVFGGVAPFGAAVTAALPGADGYMAAAGALLGYIFRFGVITNMKCVTALLLTVIFKWTYNTRFGRRETVLSNVLVAALAMAAASAAIILAMDYNLYDIMLSAAELMLSCGAAYFFTRALKVLETGVAGAAKPDISCAAVSLAVVLMGLSGFTVRGLSSGRVFSAVIIMLCARYGGEAVGAVTGVIAGTAAGLSSGDYGFSVAAYSLGGLVAGAVGDMGRVAAAAAFIIVNALTALFTGEDAQVYIYVAEIFIAAVLFMLVPKRLVRGIRLASMTAGSGAPVQLALKDRLGDISAALREIGGMTRKIGEKLGKLETPGTSEIYTGVADKVCRRCGMKAYCWQTRYHDTVRAFEGCVNTLKRSGTLGKDDITGHLVKHCCKLDSLIGEINASFTSRVAKEGIQRKVSKVRSVVTDQFDGMAMALEGISGELSAIRLIEPQKEARVKDYIEKEGLSGEKLLCYTDALERLCVEMQIPSYQAARINRAKAAVDLGGLLEAELDLPDIRVKENTATVRFGEKASFSVEIGAYQIASNGARFCGDAYDHIKERAGKTHLIISDGMGTGGNAAVDSSMASGLITSLLSIGVAHEAALKLVNSALLIKSGEESLATIDVCTIDLYTGRADFYKAGAAPSFVIRQNRAGCIETASLPAGILRGVSFEKTAVNLKAGDTVVMVSDGVVTTGAKWVISELESMDGADIQRLCEKLAMTARSRREDGRDDDITVVAAVLNKGI